MLYVSGGLVSRVSVTERLEYVMIECVYHGVDEGSNKDNAYGEACLGSDDPRLLRRAWRKRRLGAMVANRAHLLLGESGSTSLPVRCSACLCCTAECRGCECAHGECTDELAKDAA